MSYHENIDLFERLGDKLERADEEIARLEKVASLLQRCYESEQNFRLESFFDAGVMVMMGDGINGWGMGTMCEDMTTAIIFLAKQCGVE